MACSVTVPQRPTCTFQERAIDVGAVPIYACVNKVQASGNRAAYNAGLRAGDRQANVGGQRPRDGQTSSTAALYARTAMLKDSRQERKRLPTTPSVSINATTGTEATESFRYYNCRKDSRKPAPPATRPYSIHKTSRLSAAVAVDASSDCDVFISPPSTLTSTSSGGSRDYPTPKRVAATTGESRPRNAQAVRSQPIRPPTVCVTYDEVESDHYEDVELSDPPSVPVTRDTVHQHEETQARRKPPTLTVNRRHSTSSHVSTLNRTAQTSVVSPGEGNPQSGPQQQQQAQKKKKNGKALFCITFRSKKRAKRRPSKSKSKQSCFQPLLSDASADQTNPKPSRNTMDPLRSARGRSRASESSTMRSVTYSCGRVARELIPCLPRCGQMAQFLSDDEQDRPQHVSPDSSAQRSEVDIASNTYDRLTPDEQGVASASHGANRSEQRHSNLRQGSEELRENRPDSSGRHTPHSNPLRMSYLADGEVLIGGYDRVSAYDRVSVCDQEYDQVSPAPEAADGVPQSSVVGSTSTVTPPRAEGYLEPSDETLPIIRDAEVLYAMCNQKSSHIRAQTKARQSVVDMSHHVYDSVEDITEFDHIADSNSRAVSNSSTLGSNGKWRPPKPKRSNKTYSRVNQKPDIQLSSMANPNQDGPPVSRASMESHYHSKSLVQHQALHSKLSRTVSVSSAGTCYDDVIVTVNFPPPPPEIQIVENARDVSTESPPGQGTRAVAGSSATCPKSPTDSHLLFPNAKSGHQQHVSPEKIERLHFKIAGEPPKPPRTQKTTRAVVTEDRKVENAQQGHSSSGRSVEAQQPVVAQRRLSFLTACGANAPKSAAATKPAQNFVRKTGQRTTAGRRRGKTVAFAAGKPTRVQERERMMATGRAATSRAVDSQTRAPERQMWGVSPRNLERSTLRPPAMKTPILLTKSLCSDDPNVLKASRGEVVFTELDRVSGERAPCFWCYSASTGKMGYVPSSFGRLVRLM